jgi:hypothetical protein
MVRAVDRLRLEQPNIRVELYIVSAAHGLVGECELLAPYDKALGSSRGDWVRRGLELGLPGAVARVVEQSECTIIALSRAYAIAAGMDQGALGRAIVLGGQDNPAEDAGVRVASGRREARLLGCAEREVRGRCLDLLLLDAGRQGWCLLERLLAGEPWRVEDHLQAQLALPA